jgi:hypothetical protein
MKNSGIRQEPRHARETVKRGKEESKLYTWEKFVDNFDEKVREEDGSNRPKV